MTQALPFRPILIGTTEAEIGGLQLPPGILLFILCLFSILLMYFINLFIMLNLNTYKIVKESRSEALAFAVLFPHLLVTPFPFQLLSLRTIQTGRLNSPMPSHV